MKKEIIKSIVKQSSVLSITCTLVMAVAKHFEHKKFTIIDAIIMLVVYFVVSTLVNIFMNRKKLKTGK